MHSFYLTFLMKLYFYCHYMYKCKKALTFYVDFLKIILSSFFIPRFFIRNFAIFFERRVTPQPTQRRRKNVVKTS